MKKNPPCVKGLKEFKRCPQKGWDGEEGCPYWLKYIIPVQKDGSIRSREYSMCGELWKVEFQYRALGLLEGNQRATESFRNNVSTDAGPKPDPAMVQILGEMKKQQELNEAIKERMQIGE